MSDSNASNALVTTVTFYADALATLSASASKVERELEGANKQFAVMSQQFGQAIKALQFADRHLRQMATEIKQLRDPACQPDGAVNYDAVGLEWRQKVEQFGL